MSQEDVFHILKDLGGEATTSQIREAAKKKYPSRTLYMYVSNRLNKLKKWGIIVKEGEKWKIVKEF